MRFLDRLFGSSASDAASAPRRAAGASEDEHAIERYRYLLRTAPPETIEQVHAEAFAKLTDPQRAVIYEELSRGAGTGERPLSSEPATLARAATRAEMRQPGAMERVVGGTGGMGQAIAGSLLGAVAGSVIGSTLVSAFLPWDGGWSADAPADTADASGGGLDYGAGDLGL